MVARVKTMTFAQCAKAYIAAHQAGVAIGTAQDPVGAVARNHVFPVTGDLPVQSIDTKQFAGAGETDISAPVPSPSRGSYRRTCSATPSLPSHPD